MGIISKKVTECKVAFFWKTGYNSDTIKKESLPYA